MAEESKSHHGAFNLQAQPPLLRRLRDWLEHSAPFARGKKQAEAGRAPRSRRHRRRRVVIAIVAALLAYPVLGTLALSTGLVERIVHSEDLRVELTGPAYTIWPGRVHVAHARILANGDTQFILEGHDLRVDVQMRDLIKRRVHVTELSARDVRYQMRVQVEDDRGVKERLAAYPPLSDIPGAKVIHEKAAEKTEPREASWTVEVEGLDVSVVELWFFEYRYLGDGRLRGGFLVGPRVMRVSTAVQDLGPGELRFGAQQVIAKNLRGQISADIPTVNPEEHADTSFFELVQSHVRLFADVQSLAHVSAYFDELEVSQGRGPFAVELFLNKGVLGPKSHMEFNTNAVRVKGDGFGVDTDWRIEFGARGASEQGKAGAAEGLPELRSSSNVSYVSFARGEREFTLQVQKHREEATLNEIRLSGTTTLKRASAHMPDIRTVDLDDLGALLPEGVPVSVKRGEARASLSLNMDENFRMHGPVRAEIDGMSLDVAGVEIAGTTPLDAAATIDLKRKTNALSDLAVRMRDFAVRAGNESADRWWMDLKSERLALKNTDPMQFDGSLSIRARDLEPVLESLAEKDALSKVIPALTSLSDFRCKATIRSAGAVKDVILASESDVWDVAGRVHMNGDDKRIALVIGGQAVSVGIAKFGEELEIMPFAKTGWLNERLRAFPAPVEMVPAKP